MVQTEDEPEFQEIEDEEFNSGKIYCANCLHCKLIPGIPAGTPSETPAGGVQAGDEQQALRIRCAAGKWKKRLGEEKVYKYLTITRRCLDSCDSYEEMGETREFIRELRKSLSNKDEALPQTEALPDPAEE
jgi:hypothetical protein